MKKLAAIALLFIVASAHGANCYQFTLLEAQTGWHASPDAAKAAYTSYCLAQIASGPATECGVNSGPHAYYSSWQAVDGNSVALSSSDPPTMAQPAPYVKFKRITTALHPAGAGITDGPYSSNAAMLIRVNPAGCPNCSAGESHDVARDASTTAGTLMCGSDSCEYTATRDSNFMISTGIYHYWTQGSKTGNQCTPEAPAIAPDTPIAGQSADQHCYTSGSTTACTAPSGTNCGTVNGDQVCATSVAPGECATLGSGAMICGSTAALTTPPAPNNGSSTSQPATPTVEYNSSTSTTTNTSNYYSSTVVNNQASSSSSSSGGSGSSSSGSSGYCSTNDCSEVGQPQHDTSKFKEYGDGSSTWGDGAGNDATGKNLGKVQAFMNTMKNTLPFSLLASPVVALSSGTPAAPGASFHLSGHAINWSLEGFDEVFSWVRAAEGMLLVFGFYLVMLTTIRGWSK